MGPTSPGVSTPATRGAVKRIRAGYPRGMHAATPERVTLSSVATFLAKDQAVVLMSTSFVSRTKSRPITSVMAATITGYHRPE
jgi:hypothetical protein